MAQPCRAAPVAWPLHAVTVTRPAAGLHKKVRAEMEELEARGERQAAEAAARDELGRLGAEKLRGELEARRGGEELAAEVAAEARLQGQVEEEMLRILEAMGGDSDAAEGDGGAGPPA